MNKETFEQMALPGEKISTKRGFFMWFSRESWGHIFDGLILERERSIQRKAANPESNSDDIADRCAELMDAIRIEGQDTLAYQSAATHAAAARIEELEVELAAEKESHASAHADALRQAEHLGQSVARIAELEKQRDRLLAALKSAVETIEWMHGCASPADDEIEKAINEGNTVIASVKGK